MLIILHALHCVDRCFFAFLPYLTICHTVLVSALTHFDQKKMIYILCLNPLTGELKVRVVGFVLKKLITYLNLLILPHFTLGTCSVLHCE